LIHQGSTLFVLFIPSPFDLAQDRVRLREASAARPEETF
jgi:hypothetical protein